MRYVYRLVERPAPPTLNTNGLAADGERRGGESAPKSPRDRVPRAPVATDSHRVTPWRQKQAEQARDGPPPPGGGHVARR